MSEKYDQALNDFTQYSELMPLNGMGFVGVGDSHKALKQWQQAIAAYSKAI
jgi:tetratricopeptide (TPR) repeat protein